jgi:hypothetical protein
VDLGTAVLEPTFCIAGGASTRTALGQSVEKDEEQELRLRLLLLNGSSLAGGA